MRFSLRAPSPGPVLTSRAASFGARGFSRQEAGGTLALFEDRLVFTPSDGAAGTEIPLAEVSRMAVSTQRERDGRLTPVLKIVWRRNLVFGVAVPRPDRWMNAVESLTRGVRSDIAFDRAISLSPENPNFRWVMAVLLVLVLTVSVGLPLFFTWMQSRVNTPASLGVPAEAAEEDRAVGS